MVSLKLQKRLAASVLKCGKGKVWLDPNEVSEISMANSQSVDTLEAKKETEEIEGLKSLVSETQDDIEMQQMASEELGQASEEETRLHFSLLKSLLPKDDADERDCILEVRAGTGGDEASLFAMDIFKMYEKYSQKKGWRFEVLDVAESDLKGYKVWTKCQETCKGWVHHQEAHQDPPTNPFGGEYTIFAGLEECIRLIANFRFTDDEIAFIKSSLPSSCEVLDSDPY
ncbi:hypothetical protein CASFOL_025264 [Castilleja foliolosa]|uniref:Ribosomal protein L19 n=1 Tax=Castilleja foliolosa TaxID=1961234 RepID=A0ABD3CQN6_9LAMI